MEEQNPSINDVQLPNFELNTTHNEQGKVLQKTSDRISDLPKELLIQILSSLNTNDAVRTGILSKSWENLWTNVNHLVYGFEWISEKRTRLVQLEKFISFVDRTLMLNTQNNIEKFALYACSGEFRDASEVVDKWLQCIFKKNVKIFQFRIIGLKYSPPKWFYQNSSFVKLGINYWNINIAAQESVSWTSLKYLALSHVIFENNWQIDKILSGCPFIETLFLCEVKGIKNLNIVSPSLKELCMIQYINDRDLVDINAPWLRKLEIYGTFSYVMPFSRDMFSLINVTLDSRYSEPFELGDSFLIKTCNLLENICHVEELKLGKLFIQALSMTKHLGLLSPLFKCKRLTILLSVSKYDLFGIARLLQSAPNLETLVMEVEDKEAVWRVTSSSAEDTSSKTNFEKYFDGIWDLKENKYLNMQMEDFPYLRTIEFEAQSSDKKVRDKKVFNCEILAYILRHARVKEKLIIKSRRRATAAAVEYASLLAHKLKSNLEIDGEFEFRQNQSSFEFKFCN